MGLRGPSPKSAAVRELEGSRAHRPMPTPSPAYAVGAPERPKGMTAAARRIWDGYVSQLAGTLRLVDGFALARLCEDVGMLDELQAGMRKMAADMKKEARGDSERLKSVEDKLAVLRAAGAGKTGELEAERMELLSRRLSGGAMISLAKTHEGRRITATINSLAGRIQRQEAQFGLTPASAARVAEAGIGMPMAQAVEGHSIEDALCG